jgi:D-threo-aldose 1-dehydrogenase
VSLRDKFSTGPLGFGAAALGNMFRTIPNEQASATVDAAWQHGIRFFVTAPFYGGGLSEIRLGAELARHDRDEYVLSTKVGRIITGNSRLRARDSLFELDPNNIFIYDYTEQGTLRSIDDSLRRLGVDRLDFVWVHDIAQDFHGNAWLAQFETARTGAFRALSRLRDEGVIKGWGLSVNRTEPVELMLGLSEANPDGVLLAGRYTLLDHEHALQRLMPVAKARGVDIIIGGPYSSGMLASEAPFNYANAPLEATVKVASIKAVAQRHSVPIKAAALQFALAHPASAAIIPSCSRPDRIAEDHAALSVTIPDGFWQEMREKRLVAPDAPLPIDT